MERGKYMQKYLHKIQRFYEQKKRMPSLREVADLLGFRSKNAAVRVVDKLEEAGWWSRMEVENFFPAGSFAR